LDDLFQRSRQRKREEMPMNSSAYFEDCIFHGWDSPNSPFHKREGGIATVVVLKNLQENLIDAIEEKLLIIMKVVTKEINLIQD